MGIQDLLKREDTALRDADLGALSRAVELLQARQKEVDDAEDRLKKLKRDLRDVSENIIPEMMDNLGMAKITLASGQELSIKESIQASIPLNMRDAANIWLEGNGHGDLIKTSLTVKFAKGRKQDALAAKKVLEEFGVAPSLSEGVHPGTLKAWVREELNQGQAISHIL